MSFGKASKGLAEIVLFRGLEESDLQAILQIARMESFDAGAVIFKEGDAGDAMYLVLDGKVRISRMTPLGSEEALAILGANQAFGEMSVVEDRAERSATAIAHEDCFLLALDREPFQKLLIQSPGLAHVVLWNAVRTLSARLRATNDKMMFLTTSCMF